MQGNVGSWEEYMDKHEAYLLKLLSAAIRGQQPSEPDFAPVDWEHIFSEASAHEVHTLIYTTTRMLSSSAQFPRQVMERWEKITLFSAAGQMQCVNEAYRILQLFRDSEIPVLVLKGLFLRELYPQAELRTMGDIDMLVKPADMERAGTLLETSGYSWKAHHCPHESFEHMLLEVELHYALFDQKKYPVLHEFEQRVWGRSTQYIFGEQRLLTLSVTDNLVYLLAHMMKHFLFAGFGLRQLCDVVLFVERYGLEIDGSYFWSTIQAMGYETFAVTIFEIGRQFLGLNIPVSLFYEQEKMDQELVLLLLQDIFSSGVYGRKSKEHSLAGMATKRVHMFGHMEQQYKLSLWFTVISGVLFPASHAFGERYSYVQKYPFLLPVAWLHRICFIVFSGGYSVRNLLTILHKAPVIGAKRSQLIGRLNL